MKPDQDNTSGSSENRPQTLSETSGKAAAMDSSKDKGCFFKWAVVLGAPGAIVVAVMGLLGYVPGLGSLGSIREGFIPMAPSTAISFILLGIILLAMTLRTMPGASFLFFRIIAALVSLFGLLEVAGHYSGLDLNFEDVLVPAAGHLGEIPIGRMSPATGGAFLLAGLAVFALLLRTRKPGWETRLGSWAGCLGSLVLATSIVFCLKYFLGTPLLYGQGATVPMALTTAFGFLLLGAAALGAAGNEAIPLSLLANIQGPGKSLSPRRRFIILALIMIAASGAGMTIMTLMLYRHDIDEHKDLLLTTVQTQARLIEAIAHYDVEIADLVRNIEPGQDAYAATLSQIVDAHENYQGFGDTGEFTLARRDGDYIKFVLRHRPDRLQHPEPVAFDSDLAEPMRRALSGQSGTMIGLDYRGETVLAAYEPIAVLDLGIVAKIDMAEIREPFIRSCLLAAAIALLVILAGTALFFWIGNPIIRRLEAYARELEQEVVVRKLAEQKISESAEELGALNEELNSTNEELTATNEELEAQFEELNAANQEILDAQEALRKSEARLQLSIQNMPIAFVIWDTEWRVMEWNTEAENIFGYTKEEVLGNSVINLIVPEAARLFVGDLMQGFKKGNSVHFSEPNNNIRKDGHLISCKWINTPLADDNGEVFAVMSMAEEITERLATREALARLNKEMNLTNEELIATNEELETQYEELVAANQDLVSSQDALAHSEELFRTVVTNSLPIVIMFDLEGKVLLSEGKMLAAIGLKPGELVGQNVFKVYEDYPDIINAFNVTLAGKVFEGVIKLGKHFFEVFFSPNMDRGGDVVGVIGMAQNITKRKQAEQALQESEEQFRRGIIDAPVPIMIHAEDGEVLQINNVWTELTGYELCDIPTIADWTRNAFGQEMDDIRKYIDSIFERNAVARDGEFPIVTKTSQVIYWEFSSGPLGILPDGRRLAISMATDVTERKYAAEELQASKDLLGEAQKVGKLGYYSLDVAMGTWTSSEVLNEIFGIPADYQRDTAGWFKLIYPDDLGKMQEYFSDNVLRQHEPFDKEYRIKRLSDGDERWVHGLGELKFSDTGDLIQMIGTIQDITERKQSEEQLQRLNTAIQQAAEAVMITDIDGNIQYVNPAFCTSTGFTEEEAIGQNPRIIKSDEHDEAFYKVLWDTITSGKSWHGRFVNKRKDGTLIQEDATISPVFGTGGQIINYVAVKRDVTHEVSLEQQLRQTQKLEAIGTLAGGIAHDFNNILFAIMGNAELAADELPKDHPARDNIREVITAGERAAELVKQILTFARRGDKRTAAISVASIVKEVVKMLQASLPTTIGINLRLNTGNTTIIADPTEIHQVIMNLCTNAGQAMSEQGGELEIGLSALEVDELVLQHNPDLQAGPHLLLSVDDTGPGMPSGIQQRIFEPFFTTKTAGRGTGMGLAVVHGIVKELGGAINVSSEVGKGTSFKVYLPLADTKDSTEVTEASEIPRGTERVLVVDDEPAIANMMADILKGLGYSVQGFTDSQEALAAFLNAPDDFDLIITDQTMHNLTGAQLAQKILAKHPQQPIILLTGFSQTLPREKAEGIGISAYINKPASRNDLANTVRRVLDQG